MQHYSATRDRYTSKDASSLRPVPLQERPPENLLRDRMLSFHIPGVLTEWDYSILWTHSRVLPRYGHIWTHSWGQVLQPLHRWESMSSIALCASPFRRTDSIALRDALFWRIGSPLQLLGQACQLYWRIRIDESKFRWRHPTRKQLRREGRQGWANSR